MSTSQPVLDATLLDYLRISSYDVIQYYHLSAAIERSWGSWRPHKWLQYKGRQSKDGIFHGIGEQNKRPHCVISVSGGMAHIFYTWLERLGRPSYNTFYCTRIDLQRTRAQPDKEYRATAYKRLRGSKSLITSDTGTTLYIGARTSDTFWRLYDKTDKHLRCEIEIKSKQAKRAFVALLAGEQPGGIFNRFLLRSRVPKVYVEYFHADSEASELPTLDEQPDYQKKLDWLITLDSLVYKLLLDHDTNEGTSRVVRRWAEYADNIDKQST